MSTQDPSKLTKDRAAEAGGGGHLSGRSRSGRMNGTWRGQEARGLGMDGASNCGADPRFRSAGSEEWGWRNPSV